MWVDTCDHMFTACKTQKLGCKCIVAHNFGMGTTASEHTWHMSDAHHKLTLGFATLHVWGGGTVNTYIQWNALVLQLGSF